MAFDCEEFYRVYYQIYSPNLTHLYPWSALPFGTDTYFLEIDCSLRREYAEGE